MEYLNDAKTAFEAAREHLQKEVASIRTGRANPVLLEQVYVEAYGSRQPLKNVATITTPDSKTIMVEPWDKSVLAEVEKGINEARIGLNPVNDGTVIRLPIPALTEESRKELVKTLKGRIEDGKIRLRRTRDDVRGKIAQLQKDGEITEDQKFTDQEKLDKMVKEYNDTMDTMFKEKESEIMTV